MKSRLAFSAPQRSPRGSAAPRLPDGLIIGWLLLGLLLMWSPPAAARSMLDGYVACSYSDDCYPFNLQGYEVGPVIEILPEGDYPYDAVMDFLGHEVWIPGASGDGVAVIDRATDTVSHRIPVGDYLVGLCFGFDGSFALASSRDENRVYRLSTEAYSVLDFLPLDVQPGNLALDPTTRLVYAVEWYGDLLHEISADGTTLLRSVSLGSSLWQLVVDPGGQYVYVTDRGTDQVRVVDPVTLSQTAAVPVGDDPWGLDVTADGAKLVCTCEDSHNVYVIEVGSWATTIIPLSAGADPRDVDILDSERVAFVCGGDDGSPDSVYVIDMVTNELLTSFGVPGGSNTNVIAVQPQMHEGSGNVGPDGGGPARLSLRIAPHPVAGSACIAYELSQAGDVELAVYDLLGRQLAVIERGVRAAGSHAVLWDGQQRGTSGAARGSYFLQLRVDGAPRDARAVILGGVR